jgi:hypothetical protein
MSRPGAAQPGGGVLLDVQRLGDVGRVAAELLLAAIGGQRDRDVHTVPSRLAVRESGGGYPAAGDRVTEAGKRGFLTFRTG